MLKKKSNFLVFYKEHVQKHSNTCFTRPQGLFSTMKYSKPVRYLTILPHN